MSSGNGITNRELFQKLLSIVETNHKVQEAQAQATLVLESKITTLTVEVKALRALLEAKFWQIITLLIIALAAVVGIKLLIPALG